MEKQFEGMKKAIVVGASSGIGMEVARLLLKQGWKVGVAARRIDLLKTIGDVETEQIDVTKPEATQQLQHLIERVGGMDLFFYASGIGKGLTGSVPVSPDWLFRLFQLDAFVERLVTAVALWQQVDAEAAAVLAHVEVIRAVHLVALYLQF